MWPRHMPRMRPRRARKLAGAAFVAAVLLASAPSLARGVPRPIPGLAHTIARLRRLVAFRHDWRLARALYPAPDDRDFIVVDVARERLYLFENGRLIGNWPVSTARDGVGERNGSLQTPTGLFRIVGKFGAGLPAYEILQGQMPSGRIASPVRARHVPAANRIIVGRVLRLEGLEPGWNLGGVVDTFQRHIYIHGTPDLGMLGRPASDGCIQMAPNAVIELFRVVPSGTPMLITAGRGNLRRIPGLVPSAVLTRRAAAEP